jgi:hypothetical protein
MELQALEFGELADLRLFLHDLRSRQVDSLKEYFDSASGGFYHRHDKRRAGEFSKSSTATCVLSLIAANQWRGQLWHESTERLVSGLLRTEWKSAGLPAGNLFTVSFILEAVTALLRTEQQLSLDEENRARIAEAQRILREKADNGPMELSVQGYPPSAYVAQLVIRTLKKQETPFEDARHAISEWAEHEINKQIALLTRNDKTADVFQLVYAVILLTNLLEPASVTPDQDFIVDAALEVLFERQREDGTWPLSRPLFHYPTVGSAHCYDYEMLVQLLSESRLREKLLRFVPQLAKSARALTSSFPLGLRGRGWSSGHHPQLHGPESWSTASVYHFAHAFERLLAEQIRIETFAYLRSPYTAPQAPSEYLATLPDTFLDCQLELDGTPKSLREAVSTAILQPLIKDEQNNSIESGSELSDDTPVSVIFFGPPGTSKTDLADKLHKLVGWPLLAIDASQFLKNGMDGVYAEADRIFGMLAVAERIVVLLDEFDEMVRAREKSPDVLSRFLTTAMLPKLHKIHQNRRLVFIVATNHIDWFDVAIRRPGRFDVILQVMPPTAAEKLRKWPELLTLTEGVIAREELDGKLEPLTFLETKTLVKRLGEAPAPEVRGQRIESAYNNCTLLSQVPMEKSGDAAGSSQESEAPAAPVGSQSKTWKTLCDEQRDQSRVL